MKLTETVLLSLISIYPTVLPLVTSAVIVSLLCALIYQLSLVSAYSSYRYPFVMIQKGMQVLQFISH